jgi:hypothetical protein
VEIFGWNFSANNYSALDGIVLSSAVLVNAANDVQPISETSRSESDVRMHSEQSEERLTEILRLNSQPILPAANCRSTCDWRSRIR